MPLFNVQASTGRPMLYGFAQIAGLRRAWLLWGLYRCGGYLM